MRHATDRIRLTQKAVADLLPFANGRRHVYDDVAPSLAVCVTEKGAKSFYWIGRVNKAVSRLQIGTWPKMSVETARAEAQRITADVASGSAPKRRKLEAKLSMRLGSVWEWYFDNIAKPNHKAWKTENRVWERDVSKWSQVKIEDLRKADVVEHLKEIRERYSRSAENRAIDLLRALYRCATDHFGVQVHDFTQTLVKHQFDSRERFLEPEEIGRFFEAVNNLRRQTSRDFFKLCVFTGARRNNILQMRWEEIDFDGKLWRIPREKSKGKREMKVQLTEPALDILTRRKEASHGSPWVFPSTSSKNGHISDMQTPLETLRRTSGLEHFTIHDLRRTLGSWQAMTGASLINIGKSLGHRSSGATQVYARLTDSSVKESIEKAIQAMMEAGKSEPPETK
jgi:integrase